MPVGPNGQIRPDSSFSAVIMAAKIATGEIEEQYISEEHKRAHQRNSFLLTITPCEREEQD